MRLFLLIFILAGCGPDLCSEQKWQISKLQREADMWESIAHDWQTDYYNKDCNCPLTDQQYYHEPETVSL